MTKFLTLKHWQLFAVLFGIPLVIQIITLSSVIKSNGATPVFFFFPVFMFLATGLYMGWFYVLGIGLYKKLPPTAPMNLNRFKLFLIIPLVYILLISLFISGVFFSSETGKQLNPFIFLLIFPLHLFSMFCIFYCLYFNAKALKAVEWQRPVTFSDFVGEFFLLWFFPIGVWILQPRINKLFDTNLNNSNDQKLNGNIQ